MNILNIKQLSSTAMLAGCLVCPDAHAISQLNQDKPNIILIYLDDMGYGDVGVTGSKLYDTPNIDRLAAQGMRFTSYYSPQPVSSASRAGLMTGCYPNRVGITGALMPQSEIGLNPEETTIAEITKSVGYKTIAIGKWHLGHQEKFLPLQQGFDEYFGLPYSNDMWPVDYDGNAPAPNSRKSMHPILPLIEGNNKIGEIKTLADQDQLTTMYTERSVKFINENYDHPFFIYLAHSMPHVPLGVSDKFKGKSEQGMYGDVMMEIDWSVGEIIKALELNSIDNNTLIIFTSDNGPWLNFGNHAGSTGGLREGKNTSWEGGQRVPCIMSWPRVIQKGVICNELASSIDLLPTIAEICDASLPKEKIDGISLLSLIKGVKGACPRHEFLYYFQANSLEAVQIDHWKLILPHSGQSYKGNPGNDGFPGTTSREKIEELELYDLRRDPGERYNVIDLYPEKVKELEELVNRARLDLGDDLTNNKGKNRREPGKL
jgi:arylsulfatase A-like enzyme